jgi:hypothetical protein
MDFDDGDDHHRRHSHPYGYDPACACSDRFSWLLFRQPLIYRGTNAAVSLALNEIP